MRRSTLDGHALVMCHYAFRTWKNMGRGWIDLHGHSHAKLKPQTRQFDVGVDALDYRPVTLETILASRTRRRKAMLKWYLTERSCQIRISPVPIPARPRRDRACGSSSARSRPEAGSRAATHVTAPGPIRDRSRSRRARRRGRCRG